MTNKESYLEFCKSTYVPIYSKPWYMDAICLPEHWDVWMYEKSGNRYAAMPYYVEYRGDRKQYKYITKAPFTQTNGIVFLEDECRHKIAQAEMEKKAIDAACEYIKTLGLDVYEQQYSHTFTNWSPFY